MAQKKFIQVSTLGFLYIYIYIYVIREMQKYIKSAYVTIAEQVRHGQLLIGFRSYGNQT